MTENSTKTFFASPERASSEDLDRQIRMFEKGWIAPEISQALPVVFLILNSCRQTVYANRRVLEIVGAEELTCLYGQRPGELLSFQHAPMGPAGCGTSRYCENCGAVLALLEASSGSQAVKECRLTLRGEEAADFRIWVTPFIHEGEQFYVFTLQDIGHEKRRQVLERAFFHDILNTAGGIKGLVDLLRMAEKPNEKEQLIDLMERCSRNLVEEVLTGRALSLAESNELVVERVSEEVGGIVQEVVDMYRSHPVCMERNIRFSQPEKPVHVITDGAILRRVLGNLFKNALEAIGNNRIVTVRVGTAGDSVLISVHNEGAMPISVQRQVFQRSFSTKGVGRGIGTYSVRLFTEKYLHGKVSFTSREETGTTFTLKIPRGANAA